MTSPDDSTRTWTRNNSIFQVGFSEEDERAYLADVVSTIREGTAHPPRAGSGRR